MAKKNKVKTPIIKIENSEITSIENCVMLPFIFEDGTTIATKLLVPVDRRFKKIQFQYQ